MRALLGGVSCGPSKFQEESPSVLQASRRLLLGGFGLLGKLSNLGDIF